LLNPQSNPAAILHQMRKALDARLISEIQRELHLLDESLDFALEFEGARKQLKDIYSQRKHAKLLDSIKEKSLSQLTDEERALLKLMNSR
jgi:DNA primase